MFYTLAGRTHIGYYFEENGDAVPDPDLRFIIREGKVTSISCAQCWGPPMELDSDDPYAYSVLRTMWKRHIEPRCAAMTTGGDV